jgi:class 3 adenylate cyclase
VSFIETVRRARDLLKAEGRISLRGLKREFGVDDDALEDLVEELVDVQQVAALEGKVLSWIGAAPREVGEAVAQTSAAPEASAPERSLRDYTPKHLAEEILRSKSALEGERKQVTVLFADVKDSTELAERVGPEQWHDILDGYLRLLAAGVHRFEGTVNQYTGDGIMAIFGAPIAHEDHAQRACYAALWLRGQLDSYARHLRRVHGLDFVTRIGLNSGEVVVGKIGDDLRMDYTAQGQTVHLAMRMEQLAESGRPCLAPATAALVEGFFVLDDLGDFHVKGVAEPLRVRALAGVGQAQTRLDVARARGLSQFVGRVREMDSLEAALARAQEEHGQIVGVVGEAGVGKSRLCSQFADRARSRGVAVYLAHCPSHGKTISLLPILELLRALLGVSEGESPHDQRQRIACEISFLDASLRDVLPLVLDFLGVADPEQSAPRLEPEARQRRLFHFVRRLVKARSARGALVLFIDDVHWIDAGSDAFLAQLVEAVADAGALLLLTFRPDYHADWMARSEYQQLGLQHLVTEEIEALLSELIGHDASVDELRDLVRERTGGNPFFMEEVVHSLAESGVLAGARGAYRLVEPAETVDVPSTVQPVLAARIDRLAEREKHALQAASVVGREFSAPLLAAVLEWPEADLTEALEALKSGEFLYAQSLYPVAEYAFKHPLTQEVALGSQLRGRRARTHARVARALEASSAERLDEQAALIAHHHEGAGEVLEAARWHNRAAEWLFRRDQRTADWHWRRAYELAKSAPSTEEGAKLLLQACTRLVMMTAFSLGLRDDERDRFAAEGRELAERLGDRMALFMLECGLAISGHLTGESSESPMIPAQRAVELAEGMAIELQVAARLVLANSLWGAGRASRALRVTDETLELAGGDPNLGVLIMGFSATSFAMGQRGALLMWLGRPGEAEACFERSREMARERDEVLITCMVNWYSGPAFEHLTGDSHDALARAQQAVEEAELFGSPFYRVMSLVHLGWTHLMHAHVAEALDLLQRVDRMQRERAIARVLLNLAQGLLAEAYLAAGEANDARTVANRCTAGRDAWVYELYSHLSRSRVLRALDGADARGEIEGSLVRAQLLLEKSGARGFAPLIVEERARLFEVLGDAEGADRALREALRIYAEVAATGHMERLKKELRS